MRVLEEFVKYECNKCGCIFYIEEQFIDIAKKMDRYLCCPLGHKNIAREEDIENIMMQRSAVEL